MMNMGLSADDIMLADRLSYVTGMSFEDILTMRQEAAHWRDVAARLGVLFGADVLPRVQIPRDQLAQLMTQTGLTEEKVTLAFIMASRLGQTPADVANQMKAGRSAEAIYATSYEKAYR
jgi:hypothetical protein